jgi:uncharacterized protein YjbI with pentapeptide repeats
VDQQQEPRWQPTRRQLLWASGIVAVLTLAVLIGYRYGITLWDWLKLLVVPAVIAGGGIWFNQRQQARDQVSADRRTQDDALEAYLDDMTDLMINHHLRGIAQVSSVPRVVLHGDSPPQGEDTKDVRAVARARTLTLLTRLDGERKGHVVRFLYESGLISQKRELTLADLTPTPPNTIVDVAGEAGADPRTAIVDLAGADLRGTILRGAILMEVDLRNADLRWADLSDASLSGANLSSSDLRGSILRGASFRKRFQRTPLPGSGGQYTLGGHGHLGPLEGANLRGADLRGADLRATDLRGANLEGADLSAFTGLPLERKAIPVGELLQGVVPAPEKGATLSWANLSDASLSGAILRRAILSYAEGVTNEQLAEAESLEGATIPDGQKYEDWLKDNKAQGKDEQNE